MKKIGVIGSGSWGTALAEVVSQKNDNILMWARSTDVADSINNTHENTKYLASVALNENISCTTDISEMSDVEMLILVVPAQGLRYICKQLQKVGISSESILVIACKGVEKDTHMLMSEIIAEILPKNPVAVLSGPNFAKEIAQGLPACATIACSDKYLGTKIVESLSHDTFRAYYSSDVIGAQIGGAVKNVLAIACGIAIGRGLGENSRAALVTRGMVEISRLCIVKGGKVETLMGLSGIGDIMLTCGSETSRNMSLGMNIGKGKCANDLIASGVITEGVATSISVVELAKNLKIDMPICKAVSEILFNNVDVDSQIKGLLSRPLTEE